MRRMWSVWAVALLGQLALAAQLTCPAARPACQGDVLHPDNQNIFFRVSNTTISVEATSIQLTLECRDVGGRLDVAALPRYEQPVVFEEVYINSCRLENASVADVLGALGVPPGEVAILAVDGVSETLRAAHFAGLNVTLLKLTKLPSENSVQLEDDFFSVFQNLSILDTTAIQYDRPPSGLAKWRTVNAKLRRLYEECVTTLKELYLTEPELTDVRALSAARRLVVLTLEAPAGELPPPPALPALRTLTLRNWNVTETQWPGSGALTWLRVQMSPLALLPAPWLRASPRLRTLELRNLPLAALPVDLLAANAELRELVISNCGLTSDMLPDRLFDRNVNLETINLSRNNLTRLPSDRLFAKLRNLTELNLSHNALHVAPDREPFLRGTHSLRVLRLDANPLGDTCAEPRVGEVSAAPWSWLRELPQLTTLSLQRTRATRLCRDWLHDMPELVDLDLQGNLITNLSLVDLTPVRSAPGATIRLQGNRRLTRIVYGIADFREASTSNKKAQATVKLNSPLTCDCQMYLFAEALRRQPQHARVDGLVCAAPGRPRPLPLRELRPDELHCAAPCPGGCACREVPARGGVLAACPRLPAGLASPRPDGLEVAELSLAGAGLSELPGAGALPPRLRLLDVRNNSIARAAPGAARGLLAAGAALRLAHNPLDCRCGARDLVDDLLLYKERVDFDDLVCEDGSAPGAAECGLGAGVLALPGVLGALALVGVVLLGALAHPRARSRLKAALRVLGVRLPGAAQPARRYDAFVSFAEADARWVAAVLVPVLERGPRPRRLCLHYRDWAVGELIPRQIAASVRASRRTLLVVSDAFARSAWARAEFDEAMAAAARDARPPPLVVLRAAPEPSALAGAPALSDYLRAATYLRADDPRFADKLRAAVPAQRRYAPA